MMNVVLGDRGAQHLGSWLLTVCFVVLCVALFPGRGLATLTAKANHDHILIDSFYHGSSVGVRGIADEDVDLVIKITSAEGKEELRKKGKVGGILWMNVGAMRFDHAPALYYLHSTKKLDDILSDEEASKNVLGYSALSRHMDISPVANGAEKTQWFDEFLKLKKAQNLYRVSSKEISTPRSDRKHGYYYKWAWPAEAAPGTYKVTVYAVKNKKIVETAYSSVLVEQAGMVKSLAGMAKNNGALYGAISVIAALGAGFGGGAVFIKGTGAH